MAAIEGIFKALGFNINTKTGSIVFPVRAWGGGNMWDRVDSHSRSCDLRLGGNLKPTRTVCTTKRCHVLVHLFIFVGDSQG